MSTTFYFLILIGLLFNTWSKPIAILFSGQLFFETILLQTKRKSFFFFGKFNWEYASFYFADFSLIFRYIMPFNPVISYPFLARYYMGTMHFMNICLTCIYRRHIYVIPISYFDSNFNSYFDLNGNNLTGAATRN